MSLVRLFQGKGFVVRVEEDLTQEETYPVINNFITEALTSNSDMIVVAIMSHGGKSDTFYSSDSKIHYLRDVLGYVIKIRKTSSFLFFIYFIII